MHGLVGAHEVRMICVKQQQTVIGSGTKGRTSTRTLPTPRHDST